MLERTGQPPLELVGSRLLVLPCTQRNVKRFHDLEVYVTDDDRFIVWIGYQTKDPRETSHAQVWEFATAEDAGEFIRTYDPRRQSVEFDRFLVHHFEVVRSMAVEYLQKFA